MVGEVWIDVACASSYWRWGAAIGGGGDVRSVQSQGEICAHAFVSVLKSCIMLNYTLINMQA